MQPTNYLNTILCVSLSPCHKLFIHKWCITRQSTYHQPESLEQCDNILIMRLVQEVPGDGSLQLLSIAFLLVLIQGICD